MASEPSSCQKWPPIPAFALATSSRFHLPRQFCKSLLLDELSKSDDFRDTWGLPRWVQNEVEINSHLRENPLFSKMGDAEIVLRFFALRHANHYKHGMQGFLDIYMRKASSFTRDDAEVLKSLYERTLGLARSIYKENVFRTYDVASNRWEPKPHKAFQDAVMIGLSEKLDSAEDLISRSDAVINATIELFKQHETGTFTGRGNTKSDIIERINLYRTMLERVLGK